MKRTRFFWLAISVIALIVALHFAEGEEEPFRFLAIGDNGCGCTAQARVAQRMIEWHVQKPFDTVVMLGDNVYAASLFGRGGGKNLFESRFDRFYKPLTNVGVKFYATLGNHDMDTRQGRDEIEDKARFHILGDKGYYSFSPLREVDGKPLVTFFVLNSERLLRLGEDPDQISWFSKSLTESKAIWKIVYFHEPIYGPEGGHKPEAELKEGIEKIMMAGGVQLVLSGHNHYYARIKPHNGIHYFISGGGGKDLYTPRKSPIADLIVKTYHFMYWEVYTDKLQYAAVAPDGPPFDQGTIPQTVLPRPAS